MNLLNITNEAKILEQLIEDHASHFDGDITDVSTIIDRWDTEINSLATKLEGIGSLIRNWEAQADAQRAEAKRLVESAKANEARADRLKEWTKFCLESANLQKAQGGIYTFSIAKTPASVVLKIPVEQLPERWIKTTIEAKKSDIKRCMDLGDVDAFEVADLVAGTALRIK